MSYLVADSVPQFLVTPAAFVNRAVVRFTTMSGLSCAYGPGFSSSSRSWGESDQAQRGRRVATATIGQPPGWDVWSPTSLASLPAACAGKPRRLPVLAEGDETPPHAPQASSPTTTLPGH